MKIAFVLTQSLDSPSGLGRYGPIAREMAKLGHEVEVIALHYAWRQLPEKVFTDRGVKVIYAGQMHVRKEGSKKEYYGTGRLLSVYLMASINLSRQLAKSQAEIIHLGKPQPFNSLAAKLAGRGRQIFVDSDDYEAETNRFSGAWQRRIVRYFEDGIVSYAAGLTTNTNFSKSRYISLGFPEENIVYVPNGVERDRFALQPDDSKILNRLNQSGKINWDKPLVLYVGTLGILSHPVDLLLDAFKIVVAKRPDAQLLLVGGGEDFDELVQKSVNLGVQSNAIFAGRVSPEQIPNCYRLATLSVDPVRDDLIAKARSPLKVVESLVLGVPVVTGDVGDRRDMLAGGDYGALVEPGNPEALAEGMLELINNEKARTRMAKAALANAEEWYWDSLMKDFLSVY